MRAPSDAALLSVVLFSGGRGSTVLSQELIRRPDVRLTLAINGYDDGQSTGEVRRFLGDSLGPSDFRKNASHLARELHTSSDDVLALLDRRLTVGTTADQATAAIEAIPHQGIRERLDAFEAERRTTGRPFDFSDCSIGNLVFAGSFLRAGRRFNAAVDDYCALVGLPTGLVENVSDGTDAYLVAIDLNDRLLASEGDIVDAKQRNRIKDIYLIDHRLTPQESAMLASRPLAEAVRWLEEHERPVPANARLLEKIASADLIVYAPGTQHSSLFPSYLTHGLSRAIARNLTAIKLLITNIQSDAEIAGTTAVEIIEKAVYYLEEKRRLTLPVPCLITHYLINDPRRVEAETSYVPLGRLDSLEDPRLVRIGNYEDGVTGRHDPAKVLTPFVRSFLARPRRQRVAVWLHDCGSPNKVTQTILEMVRARVHDLPIDVEVLYAEVEELDPAFTATLPFPVRKVAVQDSRLPRLLETEGFDYVVLFESSGMYNGEDVVSLASYLSSGRLDAVWGSRRLSVTDIEESVRLRYRHAPWLRVASTIGSHVLSAAYLLLYGRYISDTLSGVRALRTAILLGGDADISDRLLNQRLLSRLLARRAELLETPVQFHPMSPGQVRRTTVREGLRALAMMLWWRVRGAC